MTLLQPWWLLPAALFLIVFLLLSKNNSNDWTQVINSKVLVRHLVARLFKVVTAKLTGTRKAGLYLLIYPDR